MAPRSVRCDRGGRPDQTASTIQDLPRRTSSASGGSRRTREAASSMASGRPSSRRQMRDRPERWRGQLRSGRTVRARARNRRTDSEAGQRPAVACWARRERQGGTGSSCSPAMWRGARLVTMNRRAVVSASIRADRRPLLACTCSKLSSTSSRDRSRMASTMVVDRWSPGLLPSSQGLSDGRRHQDAGR